jgi:hypothetical protein
MTNKQKTITLIGALVVVLVIVILTVRGQSPDPQVPEQPERAGESEIREALSSASVIMPDTKRVVALTDGTTSFPSAPGSTSQTVVTMTDVFDTKMVDGRTDVLAIVDISYGGSGTYQYLALYEVGTAGLVPKSIGLIGDRVEVGGISTDDLFGSDGEEYLITVSYLDRAEGDPMTAEPSEPKEKYFLVENGVFNFAKTDPTLAEQGKD